MSIFHGFASLLQGSYLQLFLGGIAVTLQLFVMCAVLGFTLACLLMGIRLLPLRAAGWIVDGFVEYHRNVPSLVQLFVWYFGVPQLLPAAAQDWINAQGGEMVFAVIALTLNAAAYTSEDLRSGLRSLPGGQREAATALGMNYRQTLRKILIPQAVRAAAPSLVNQALALFKSTALAMAIGTSEMMYITRQIEGETYMTFQSFAVASLFYLAGSWTLMSVGGLWQRRIHLRAAR
ncbi:MULTISPECIES: amino acid ABC transporter permease [unclassified Pseudomonas]|uniref:amino acid ABC transporter permease n=1 Tax=unclassified Pseudomonas TaxID=196821 RepID=UPI000BC9A71F|nr:MULTISPECIES: amino acid ABC transporter permease [unclassified Pseudomonas]PVZ19597.1 polar amino acid transport system permease protein [Pseudomonas sp. URIL14HWK12:I12]PVZ22818.1 polar amino acid transport system permease protein [Pseudomonas sp. URIL14HWK12:I10]PVZ37552.1 polar amino acid transport system permease protein [Pseudomonas sp. URIL14HWK12:I11]SNZ15085.1 amino acid ABC transporter membrane protein 1, PAAT family (TC 3.A.1.3.-) [Pseudomonas sp. URIL14HWK12:I9]